MKRKAAPNDFYARHDDKRHTIIYIEVTYFVDCKGKQHEGSNIEMMDV